MPKPAGEAGHEHPAEPGNGCCRDKQHHPPTQARFATPKSCHGDVCAHAKRWWASARPRSILLLPIDPRRRDEIAAAVAAYDNADTKVRLPRSSVPLLTAMFP